MPDSFRVLQDRLADTRFNGLGEEITYTPTGGAATTVRALYMRGARQTSGATEGREEQHHSNESRHRFQLRRDEVANPNAGDRIDYDGQRYRVERLDHDSAAVTEVVVVCKRL